MTGKKRKLSDGSERPHKAAKSSENNDDENAAPASSSQPIDENAAPASSQSVADRSLSDVSETERARWREYFYPKEFFESTGWRNMFLDDFVNSFRLFAGVHGLSFNDWVVYKAQTDMGWIYGILQEKGLNERINWANIPCNVVSPTNNGVDNLVYVWTQLKKFDYTLKLKGAEDEYARMIGIMLPLTRRTERELHEKETAKAFHRDQKLTDDGQLPSEIVYQKIVRYYNSYRDHAHLSPYTSIVGPSGIGKSFAVQQLAITHSMYVVYASLARHNSTGYPRRSVIADKLPRNSTRHAIVQFWDAYITIVLSDVEVCREVGITPTGFFNLQTKAIYREYQCRIAQLVESFSYMRENLKTNRQTCIRDFLRDNAGDSRNILSKWHGKLVENNDNSSYVQQHDSMQIIPKALIAIDEASELIRDEDAILFRSLRETLRKRFRKQHDKSVNLSKPQGDFFGILLDTTSKVGNFSPFVHFDRSQRVESSMGVGRELFPPIYDIDTMDILRSNEGQIIQDGSPEAVAKLFRLGRPLWGSRYDANEDMSLDDINHSLKNLAWEKTGGERAIFNLALLSYRVNFYICSDALSSELVSRCLRYVVYINGARDFLRTIQPSEPILAFVASQKMKDPAKRLQVISQFIVSCFEGTVNIGDVGEMTASFILLFAFDEAHELHTTNPFPAAVPLTRLMETLFGQQVQNLMSGYMCSDSEMELLWRSGQVFFNHIIKLEKVPDEQTLQLGFERGAAFFLPDQFRGADILVPIRVSDRDMTFFLIQVKNRKDDRATPGLRNKAASALADAVKALKTTKNHIGIMMCLRHQSSTADCDDVEDNKDRFQVILPKTSTPRSTRQSTASTTHDWPTKGKRLIALALGFDARVYPSIDKCMGQRTEESARILPQLKHLLGCIPKISLPGDVKEAYVRRVKTLAV